MSVNKGCVTLRTTRLYKEDAVDQSNVSRWLKRLRDDNSQENGSNVMTPCKFLDKLRSGRPSSLELTNAEEIFIENRGITVQKLASELDVSVGRACGIIKSLQIAMPLSLR